MLRLELLEKLSLAAPALAKTAFMPILECFWFTGTHIIAHNDQIGICVPFKTDFKAATKGELLLGLLKNSRAKDVDLSLAGEKDAEHLLLKAAATKAKLGLEPLGSHPLDGVPKINAEKALKLGKQAEDLLHAIDLVMLSVTGDTTIPDQLGITFIPEEGGVGLFSTNDASMSYSFFKLAKKWPTRVILPSLFCTQLRVLGGKNADISLEVRKDQVIATINDADDKGPPIILFTRVIESERPHDFGRTLDAHYTPKVRKQLLPLPSRLKLICERAFIVSQDKKGNVKTSFKVEAGNLAVFTDGSGQVRDTMPLDGHPDVALDVEVSFLRSALGSYHSALEEENGAFCVTPACVIMTSGESVFMLAEKRK